VRAINVSIRHHDYVVIAQLSDIKLLAHAGTERGDQVADLFGREDLVFASLLDVEDLPTKGQDGLEATVTRALG